VSALIKNGIHNRYDIEAAVAYVVEKMLMEKGEAGEPRTTVFGGFEERPGQEPDFNPLQPRFMKYLQYAVSNIRRGKIPRLASVEQRPQGTVSIGQGRKSDAGNACPDEIVGRRSTDADFSELVEDISALLEKKERALGPPLVRLFQGILSGDTDRKKRASFDREDGAS